MSDLMMFAKDQFKEIEKRYYFWRFSQFYGWTQYGKQIGYNTIEEAKEDNDFNIRPNQIYAITQSKVIETNVK